MKPETGGIAENLKKVTSEERFPSRDTEEDFLNVKIPADFIENTPVFIQAQLVRLPVRQAVTSAVEAMLVASERELQEQLAQIRLSVQLTDVVGKDVQMVFFNGLHRSFPSCRDRALP